MQHINISTLLNPEGTFHPTSHLPKKAHAWTSLIHRTMHSRESAQIANSIRGKTNKGAVCPNVKCDAAPKLADSAGGSEEEEAHSGSACVQIVRFKIHPHRIVIQSWDRTEKLIFFFLEFVESITIVIRRFPRSDKPRVDFSDWQTASSLSCASSCAGYTRLQIDPAGF